jgi:hypothetical protein
VRNAGGSLFLLFARSKAAPLGSDDDSAHFNLCVSNVAQILVMAGVPAAAFLCLRDQNRGDNLHCIEAAR